MKLVSLGICVDNNDPKGIGRIRFNLLGSNIGAREGAIDYTMWGVKDTFVAQPFLPTNINFIPEKGQTIKIITYDNENSLVNQEYISGPFTTSHDYNSQTNSKQIENTTYGVLVEKSPDIKTNTGEYIKKKSEGSLPKVTDYAIQGKYGSDVLFTENGIQLRGGKYPTKEFVKGNQKEEILNYPIMSDNIAKLNLKKFSNKMELKKSKENVEVLDVSVLKHIVEYDVDNLDNPTLLTFNVYLTKDSHSDIFKTNVFNNKTYEDITTLSECTQLLTEEPLTFIVSTLTECYIRIRNVIANLDKKGLSYYNNLLSTGNLHPFYFRPAYTLKTKISKTHKTFLDSIVVPGVTTIKGSGLYFSADSPNPKAKTKEIVSNILKITNTGKEQSFGSITSDKIYFLSTQNKSNLDFTALDKYEYSQSDYLEKIDPNTYALVKGENLLKVLRAINDVLFTHKHNINKSISGQSEYKEGNTLSSLIKTLEDDILSKSIRIN